jgi:hypothetical protein
MVRFPVPVDLGHWKHVSNCKFGPAARIRILCNGTRKVMDFCACMTCLIAPKMIICPYSKCLESFQTATYHPSHTFSDQVAAKEPFAVSRSMAWILLGCFSRDFWRRDTFWSVVSSVRAFGNLYRWFHQNVYGPGRAMLSHKVDSARRTMARIYRSVNTDCCTAYWGRIYVRKEEE